MFKLSVEEEVESEDDLVERWWTLSRSVSRVSVELFTPITASRTEGGSEDVDDGIGFDDDEEEDVESTLFVSSFVVEVGIIL